MKKPKSKTYWTHKLDNLFSKIVRQGGLCQRCGKENVQCAHIYSRNFKSIRWNLWNALRLCPGCHFWAHQHPIDFTEFVQETIGTEQIDFLRVHSRKLFTMKSHEMESLYEELKKLEK